MKRSLLPEPAVFGFLLPNFLGFCAFLLFPILLSLAMSLTNWSLKPAVPLEYLGLRNFSDLLGFRALQAGQEAVGHQYVAAAIALLVGLVATLWSVVANWRGVKIGGVLLAVMGAVMLGQWLAVATAGWTHLADTLSVGPWRLEMGGGQGVVIVGLIFLLGGIAATRREEGSWRPGAGSLPPLILLAAAGALWALNGPMWATHELRDARFWQFFYNTLYLMMGIPVSIAGSLCLALLLNERFPLDAWGLRIVGVLLCAVCGVVTAWLLWFGLGWQNLALLCGLLWAVAALGVAVNIVTFRTIFYLPTFTSGVALMVLWKALYNPQTGPINVALGSILEWFGVNAAAIPDILPKWLADVTWSKPSLIFMGIWTGIGGTNMLLYLAGLSNVPPELLDAAQVDGAGRWARFRHVMWPQLAPTTFFISVMSIIGGLQGGFEEARVMTQGGPAGSTTTLSYYVYNKLFEELDLGYAAAISWVLFAFIFIATAINWRFGRELEVVE